MARQLEIRSEGEAIRLHTIIHPRVPRRGCWSSLISTNPLFPEVLKCGSVCDSLYSRNDQTQQKDRLLTDGTYYIIHKGFVQSSRRKKREPAKPVKERSGGVDRQSVCDVNYAVAAIAGTGSCVVSFVKRPSGVLDELGRAGGWGWILGDEGGGFHVGREAIRQMLLEDNRATVRGSAPVNGVAKGNHTLKDKVLKIFGTNEPMDLLTIIHMPDPLPALDHAPSTPEYMLFAREKRLSTLAPTVFEAAFEDDDPLAHEVLRITSLGLALQMADVMDRRLGTNAVEAEEAVACFGGSLVKVERYRNLVLAHLREMGHVFRHVDFVEDAAATGAYSLTLRDKQVAS